MIKKMIKKYINYIEMNTIDNSHSNNKKSYYGDNKINVFTKTKRALNYDFNTNKILIMSSSTPFKVKNEFGADGQSNNVTFYESKKILYTDFVNKLKELSLIKDDEKKDHYNEYYISKYVVNNK